MILVFRYPSAEGISSRKLTIRMAALYFTIFFPSLTIYFNSFLNYD